VGGTVAPAPGTSHDPQAARRHAAGLAIDLDPTTAEGLAPLAADTGLCAGTAHPGHFEVCPPPA
ncbi:MAG: hypothetical protein ACRD0D_00785, partial [Acidimicrobiales bacterium]